MTINKHLLLLIKTEATFPFNVAWSLVSTLSLPYKTKYLLTPHIVLI